MKDLIHDMDLVERFLNGTITEEERKELASRQDEEANFSKLILDMDRMVEGIKHTGSKSSIEEKIKVLKEHAIRMELNEDIEDINKETTSTKKGIAFLAPTQMRLAMAAAVALLIVSTFVVYNSGNLATEQELYAEYFEPFDSPGSGMRRSGDVKITAKASAYEAYDAGNYADAIKFFKDALTQDDEAIVDLCLANAYMKQEDLDNAEERLLHLLKEHQDLATQTKWYLALVYLKQNKLERARANLWEISTSSTYGEKAKSVLKDLE